MSFNTTETLVHTHLFAAAYGEGVYNCGNYEVGCSATGTNPGTGTGVQPPDTSVATILNEPSIMLPGSLLLAILVALITTTVAKSIKRLRARKNS